MRHEALLMLACAATALLSACAGGGTRMNDPQMSSSTVVAVPERSRGNRNRNNGERDNQEARRNNADVLVELGQRYYERGEYQIALDKLQSALSIDPNSANAHTVIAILYETINDAGKAGEHYRKSVQYAPRSGDILNNYGSWLCRQRKYEEAEAHFRRALADPFYRSPEAALANAGTCALAAGNFDQAENYFRQVLQARPNDDQALLGMAQVAYRKDDFMRARAFLQRAEAINPLGNSALELAVRIEESLGDKRSAAAYRARLAQGEESKQ